jgi:site-specific DNA-cytosine methylase
MCTDISVAGKGAGLGKRTRSGLTWREMFRLIRGLRPVLLVIENVPRLRTLGADRVLAALERIGYACRALVVGAEHVGAPHRRHRVWIIGRLDDAQRSRRNQGSGNARDEESTRGGRGEPVVADRVANPLGLDSGSGLPVAVGEAEGRTAAHRAGDCIFPGGCWRCANVVADAASGGLGTDGLARHGDRHADERGADLADAGIEGLEVGRARTGGAGAELAVSAGGSGARWPSRPGQPQHAWEAPRLTQSSVGDAASRRAGRVAGFGRRNALRALGNGNPPACAEMIGRAILAAHARAESEAA